MKRLLVTLVAIALPFTASASPELASHWGMKASDLHEMTTGLIGAIDTSGKVNISHEYEIEIERFAMTASDLALWIDGHNGPSDLGCIFRGMAQEGELQLGALDGAGSPSEARQSLVRLATMFSDAEIIAIAAMHASDHSLPATGTAEATCPVSAAAAYHALVD